MIDHWEEPKTVSELRAYLGFCNYYSGYIKMYAEYAAPMTTMLKGNRVETKKGSKKALVWNDESDRAFEGMKQALLSAVGLHLVNPDRGFVLHTDASNYAVGAVLEQVLGDGRHVAVAGAKSWRKARDGSGRPEKRRRMPSSWLSGNGLGTFPSISSPSAPTIRVCSPGTKSTWTPPQVPPPEGQDGMRPWPSSTLRLCMFLARTTPWRTVSVGGPTPPTRA